MLPKAPATFSSDGRFAHCCPPMLTPLTMSICRTCGEYICASLDECLMKFVEGLHHCAGKLIDWADTTPDGPVLQRM